MFGRLRKAASQRLGRLRRNWKSEFYSEVKDIAEHPVVLRMKLYPHHGSTNCYQHCMNVAYYNYQWCRFLHLDARSAARAGMIHDLFLYDWHTHAKKTGDRFHGLTHPEKSYQNARKFFDLNHIERDIILNHMWPVTFLRFQGRKKAGLRRLQTSIAAPARPAVENNGIYREPAGNFHGQVPPTAKICGFHMLS